MDSAQHVELNCGRIEARAIDAFDVCSQVCFPYANKAAMLMQRTDPGKDLLGHESLETLRHYTRLTIGDLKKTHRKCHPRERDEKH